MSFIRYNEETNQNLRPLPAVAGQPTLGYKMLVLVCPLSGQGSSHKLINMEPHQRRNKTSRKIQCPFKMILRKAQAGGIRVIAKCAAHNHAPNKQRQQVIATPSLLSNEQREELEQLRMNGTDINEVKRRAFMMLQECYGSSVSFTVRVLIPSSRSILH